MIRRRPVSARGAFRGLPGVRVARQYRREWLRDDVVAGVTLTALLVPQGMAYAELATLPPVTGLYVTVVALVVYALLGPSRGLVLGPDSSLSPLVAAAIVPLVASGNTGSQRVALAGMLAVLVGLLCIAAGVARLGVLAELMSLPVRVGYLNGIAVVIVVNQLPKLFGFTVDAEGLIGQLRGFLDGVADGATNVASLLIGISCLAVILGIRRVSPRVPGVLLAVAGATLAVVVFDLTTHGVSVIGAIPAGLRAPQVPDVGVGDVAQLVLPALGIAFVTLVDTTAVSRAFTPRGRDVDANREMIALGAANIAGAFFRGFPVGASSSRTSVAVSSGARTQLTGLIGAALIAVLLVAGGGLLHDLPAASLAAVVLAAGFQLFDAAALRRLARVRRSELLLSLLAFLGVALVGVLEGIAIAAALSLAEFVRRAWRPYNAVLGRIDQRKGYHDVERHPDARQIPGLVLYRFDAPLFFANANYFAQRVLAIVAHRRDAVATVVVAAEPITDVDATAADVLDHLIADLRARDISLVLAELKGPVKDRLRTYGLYERIGEDGFPPTLGTAISGHLARTGVDWVDWEEAATETVDDREQVGDDDTQPPPGDQW